MRLDLNEMAFEAHATAMAKGWYDQERNPLELIALIHTELSECVEALRNGNQYSLRCPGFTEAEEELADAMIRIGDMAVFMDFDIAGAVESKMEYNKSREKRHGGKAY